MPRVVLTEGADGFDVALDPAKVTHLVAMPDHVPSASERPQILQRCQVFFIGGASVVVKSSLRTIQADVLGPKLPTASDGARTVDEFLRGGGNLGEVVEASMKLDEKS